MNKKLVNNCSNRNLSLWIIAIFTSLAFMMQIYNALKLIQHGMVITNIKYTILEIKISVKCAAYSDVLTIGNYPLMPILAGIIYNTFILIKNHNIEEKVDL